MSIQERYNALRGVPLAWRNKERAEFENVPKIQIVEEHEAYSGGKGRPRVPYGVKELIPLVSSKKARKIVQRPELMTKAGAEKYVADRKLKYYEAAEYDVDGDKIPEVVVRSKKKNDNGEYDYYSINGYTTRASDYPFRKKYYEAYPTRASRKDKPYSMFANTLFEPKLNEDRFTYTYGIDPKGNDPLAVMYQNAKKKGYRLPLPKKKSAFKVFRDELFKLVLDEIINSIDVSKKDFYEIVGRGANVVLASLAYRHFVSGPIFKELINNKQMISEERKSFTTIQQKKDRNFKLDLEKNPEHRRKFMDYLKNRKIMKVNCEEQVKGLIQMGNKALNSIYGYVDSKVSQLMAISGPEAGKLRTSTGGLYIIPDKRVNTIDDEKPKKRIIKQVEEEDNEEDNEEEEDEEFNPPSELDI